MSDEESAYNDKLDNNNDKDDDNDDENDNDHNDEEDHIQNNHIDDIDNNIVFNGELNNDNVDNSCNNNHTVYTNINGNSLMVDNNNNNNKIDDLVCVLDKAIKGIGTDEKAIIRVITQCTNNERQHLKRAYELKYTRTLESDLVGDCSGHFLRVLRALLQPLNEYEATCLYKALVDGHSIKHRVFRNILLTKDSFNEIQLLKDTFKKLFQIDLIEMLNNKKQNDKCVDVYCKLLKETRCTNKINDNLATSQAKELYLASESKSSNAKESSFCDIFTTQSFEQLKLIFNKYKLQSRNTIDRTINKGMSGNLRDALLCISMCTRNKHEYFAHELHKCVAGVGTRDKDLLRLIVTRHEIDLKQIRACYLDLFNKTLFKVVKSDTSGHFRDILLALIGDEKYDT